MTAVWMGAARAGLAWAENCDPYNNDSGIGVFMFSAALFVWASPFVVTAFRRGGLA